MYHDEWRVELPVFEYVLGIKKKKKERLTTGKIFNDTAQKGYTSYKYSPENCHDITMQRTYVYAFNMQMTISLGITMIQLFR